MDSAMPIYEYLCESCGSKFEKLVRRTEEALESGCPSCGQKHLKQEYSTFAARAGSSSSAGAAEIGSCPAGMCGSPGMCGRN
ncbi:MAG: zinc ribbon domain-containing protein [Terriglobia bacterium]